MNNFGFAKITGTGSSVFVKIADLKEAQFMNKELCLPKNISRKLVQDQWLNLIVVNTEGKLGGSPNFLRTYKKL